MDFALASLRLIKVIVVGREVKSEDRVPLHMENEVIESVNELHTYTHACRHTHTHTQSHTCPLLWWKQRAVMS